MPMWIYGKMEKIEWYRKRHIEMKAELRILRQRNRLLEKKVMMMKRILPNNRTFQNINAYIRKMIREDEKINTQGKRVW